MIKSTIIFLLLPLTIFSQRTDTMVIRTTIGDIKYIGILENITPSFSDSLIVLISSNRRKTTIGMDQLPVSILTQAAIDAKQSIITTGTTDQYFRGDLSLSSFPSTTAFLSNSTNKNFVTDAQLTAIGNISGTNTGDNSVNSLYSSLVSNANHTGDATGSTALTLLTVNSNVGSFGSATQVPTYTVNGKGLITAASNVAIAIPESAVTNLVTDLSAKQAAITLGTTSQYFKGDLSLGTFPTTTAPFSNSTDKNFITDAKLIVLNNTIGANNGDNSANTTYANDFRAANFIAGTNYLAPNGSAAALTSFPTLNQNTTGTAAGLSANIAESQVTNLVSDLALKAPLSSATLTGVPLAPTAAAGTNTTQIATTAFVQAASPNASYRVVAQASGSHIAGRVAGTYAVGDGDPIAITGTGTLYPIKMIHIAAADYPTVDGKTTKLKLKVILAANDVAPTGNYTFGLYPITRPATSGGAGLNIYTLGTVVASSTVLFTAPAADGLLTGSSSDISLPADGFYCIGVITTATVAVSSHLHMTAYLMMRNN